MNMSRSGRHPYMSVGTRLYYRRGDKSYTGKHHTLAYFFDLACQLILR